MRVEFEIVDKEGKSDKCRLDREQQNCRKLASYHITASVLTCLRRLPEAFCVHPVVQSMNFANNLISAPSVECGGFRIEQQWESRRKAITSQRLSFCLIGLHWQQKEQQRRRRRWRHKTIEPNRGVPHDGKHKVLQLQLLQLSPVNKMPNWLAIGTLALTLQSDPSKLIIIIVLSSSIAVVIIF